MGRISPRQPRRFACLAAMFAVCAGFVGGCANPPAQSPPPLVQSSTTASPIPSPPSPIEKDTVADHSGVAARTGVFIGITPADPGYSPQLFASYDELIVDLDTFTSQEVAALREQGAKHIYSYLNIGAIEHSRTYYPRFADLAGDPYENWPDESWVDVSAPQWRDFLVGELAPQLRDKGADGFFVDNTDVYGRTPSDEVFHALRAIVSGLRADGTRVIVNGGDEFVTRLINEGESASIDAIAQESVFTRIVDFEREVFSEQDQASRAYFLSYLDTARRAGLDILLIEYAKDPAVIDEVDAQCREHGYSCFISASLMLDRQ